MCVCVCVCVCVWAVWICLDGRSLLQDAGSESDGPAGPQMDEAWINSRIQRGHFGFLLQNAENGWGHPLE